MYRFVLQKSFTVPGVSNVWHISRVTSDRVWISDGYNLILTNTTGEELDHLKEIASDWGGHTVNSDGDLIYIDSAYTINKLSTENKVKTSIIKYNNTVSWRPQCVYSSPSTGDLLVGMCSGFMEGKVMRYESTGENIQTIQHDNNTGYRLYSNPRYITENRNGDIIVSDYRRRAVVVTDREGRYRFSYTRLLPGGICTDASSDILICDYNTWSVLILDRDGNYLTRIKTSPQGIDRPYSLSYDHKTHLLWVGSWYNDRINIYRVVYKYSLIGHPKCKEHLGGTVKEVCVPCEVPLCEECTLSEDHRGHDCRDVRRSLEEVLTQIDGDAVLMCLLLSKLYRINLKGGLWIEKYNAVAESFNFKEITTESSPVNLEKIAQCLNITIQK
ncbi:uncharacterized protein LOC134245095 [Saccostrea cucullata]|uniref:uncharacterized protein LOC134245095 n=1 Tax=Saccostrea cuccullata TaxID=36930 RepID=UPI002ED02BF8